MLTGVISFLVFLFRFSFNVKGDDEISFPFSLYKSVVYSIDNQLYYLKRQKKLQLYISSIEKFEYFCHNDFMIYMMKSLFISNDSTNRNDALKKKIICSYITNGDSTIAELCREINMSIPTVTKIIGELLDDGYIVDFGKQETSGGRMPSVYGLNPSTGYFIGVDVLCDRINLGVLDFKGGKVRIEENMPYKMENTMESLNDLCERIDIFVKSLKALEGKIFAIGVNISGRVNPVSGYSYSIFYFQEKPLAQIMEEKLKIKVYVENDSRAMAYGEYMQGVVKGEKNVLFVNMSWGLGLGIIIDGKPFYGKSGFSGEFGHFCLFDNEVLCHCGKKGCLETEASGSALHRIVLERYHAGSSTILSEKIDRNEPIALNDLINAVRKEDVLSIEILERMGITLGKGIAGLINIFNPELVVLGGYLFQASEYLEFPIKSAIRKYSLNLVSQDTEIKVSKLGERAGIIGACLLARGKILGMI